MHHSVRATAAVLCGALSLLAASSLAGVRSPSLRPGMPPEVLSLREASLGTDEYRDLLKRWRAFSEEHPRSAVAKVMTSRAMRYAREGTADERFALLQEAYALDPDCPEALEALSCASLGEPGSITHAEARAYGERAIEVAPDWARPHLQLWAIDMAERNTETAARHARALIEKRGIGSPLLDFGHNLLVSAERNAIVFTNGDNDTYPPVALQARYGTRTDVRIVNLSLLNVLDYALGQLGGEAPLADATIRRAHEEWKRGPKERLFSQEILSLVGRKVRSGECAAPVYLAVTAQGAYLDGVGQALRVEGLLWRMLPEAAGSPEDGDPQIEYARTLRLLRRDFRLDSATDRAYPWRARSAVAHLMTNYPAILRLVATGAAERGDLDAVRFALEHALEIADFHGKDEMVAQLATYWDAIDPDRADEAGGS